MKNKTIYAISDIHGCLKELKELINILPLEDNSQIIFLGDYVDRGEYSREVIDYIINLKKTHNIIPLMGNHEQMMLDFFENKDTTEASLFVFNGGGATLASYGDMTSNYTIPDEHVAFLKSLRIYHETEDYFFIHAGLPNKPLLEIDQSILKDLLWIRDDFYNSTFNWGKTIIHGHTPVKNCYFSDKRINIDTGCVYGNKLSAIQLPQKEIYQVDKIEPVKHLYFKDKDSRRKAVRYSSNIPVEINTEGLPARFKAVNSSEFGMLICKSNSSGDALLMEGDSISGVIGKSFYEEIAFAGTIVRTEKKLDLTFYAIVFTITPFESTRRTAFL
ncbi:MAG: hypothetical protein GY754_18460 [bacterium]|nr:hypothetical protein [bacterium]